LKLCLLLVGRRMQRKEKKEKKKQNKREMGAA
jgi:hypothetical protein